MLVELENMKWDIVGLSASQIKDSGIEILPGGHYLYNSGNETSSTNDVGFLVHKSIVPIVSDYRGISDRLATLTLQGKSNKIIFIQVYYPTTSHSIEEVELLYN